MAIGDRREEVEGAGKEGVWPDELQCGRRTLVVALAVSIQGALLLIKPAPGRSKKRRVEVESELCKNK
jgi:hypothetical protein